MDTPTEHPRTMNRPSPRTPVLNGKGSPAGSHRRRALELGVDWIRFRLDYLTAPRYQPLPWRDAARDGAGRAEGVLSRWEAMVPVLDELAPRSALDIGCNVGWFTLSLARRGIPTVGLEPFPPYYRTALYAAKRERLENVAITAMTLDLDTASLLPQVDCTILLAVWHHFVQQHGLPAATQLLAGIWERTSKVLFFESGENEMSAAFELPPMEPDPRTWLTSYLEETCADAEIRHLGLHHGGGAGEQVAWRNLFALVRTA